MSDNLFDDTSKESKGWTPNIKDIDSCYYNNKYCNNENTDCNYCLIKHDSTCKRSESSIYCLFYFFTKQITLFEGIFNFLQKSLKMPELCNLKKNKKDTINSEMKIACLFLSFFLFKERTVNKIKIIIKFASKFFSRISRNDGNTVNECYCKLKRSNLFKQCLNLKKLTAFSLAEITITMTILGIIATILLSTIKPNDYNEKAMITKAKKVLASLDHATSMILANDSTNMTMHGLIATDGTKFSIETSNVANVQRLGELYKKYLTVKRQVVVFDDCFKGLSGTSFESDFNSDCYYNFFLKDGTCVSITVVAVTSRNSTLTCFPEETSKSAVYREARIFYDVNGSEPPNEWCKDWFNIPIISSGINW